MNWCGFSFELIDVVCFVEVALLQKLLVFCWRFGGGALLMFAFVVGVGVGCFASLR